ncbi:MAG: hypothetical protein V7637_6247 [Mycobacteriales bacterium]|jgi:hypothetical protein
MAADGTEQAIKWERSRQRHADVLQAAGTLPWRSARRLRYACFTPAGPLARLAAGAGLLAYLIWLGVRGEVDSAAVLRAIGLAALFVLLCTNRASVTEYGLSFDVAGLRQVSSFGFVPLYAVRDVEPGSRPAGWPHGPTHGGPWPGRARVHIRYQDSHGDTKVRSAWVREPARYTETVLGGRPEQRPRRKPGRRR